MPQASNPGPVTDHLKRKLLDKIEGPTGPEDKIYLMSLIDNAFNAGFRLGRIAAIKEGAQPYAAGL